MRTFISVADAGSLSAAARRIGQPLTTISRQLAQLESHLGISLIARTTRRLALTDAGRAYAQVCRRTLEELDSAEDEIAGRNAEPHGDIVITAPMVFGRLYILPIVVKFLNRHPKLNARLRLVDRVVDLTEEGVDVALRIGPLANSSLIATKVGTLRRLTCAAPAYLKAHGKPDTPDALAAQDCIVFSPLPPGGRWVFKSAAKGRRTARPNARLTVDTAEAAVDAAVAGLGITRVLSYQAEAALARNRLKVILETFDDTELPVHLVHRSTRLQKPQVRLFLDAAASDLRARLVGLR
jgi:DNA-binding transcriptional LysR family regulator